MAKPIDLRLTGVKFEDALKRMMATPPPKRGKASKPAKAKGRATGGN